MKYTPTEWKYGDVISAEKMNKLEQGVSDVDREKADAADVVAMSRDMAQLAIQSTCPNNYILYDDVGKPGVYVYIPKFRLCDVLHADSTQVHPAFIRDGKEVDGFYFGKYQSSNSGGRAYSLPGKDPGASISLDAAVSYNRAKGGKFHEVTAAEWAAIALWCHKNGTEPKGNNNYGKDINETLYRAVPGMARDSSGRIQRVATGTGPATWSHDGTLAGVWDMNGNVWEWCTGLRLVRGELQIIVDNNAADPTCDLSATSAAWKAINAETGELVTPDDNNSTVGTVKLDYDGTKWVYTTSISHDTKSAGCTFASVTCDTSVKDKVKLLLQALAMLPDLALVDDGIDATYGSDYFWANNAEAERCLIRGGGWDGVASDGVFNSALNHPRSRSNSGVGGRSAYQD